MTEQRRESLDPGIKGRLADSQEYWLFKDKDKPWDEWKEVKNTYAKFLDGTVRKFSGFEELESVELKTENYADLGSVHGMCRGIIKFDGVTVYGFQSSNVSHGLILAYGYLFKLRWLRRTLFRDLTPDGMRQSFTNRPVYYREVPARVEHYEASNGVVHLIADGDSVCFPRLSSEMQPMKTMEEDLLSECIRWDRGGGEEVKE
jgi:hypothetical protein